jgi:uncharacterized membrane protein YdbT with pleckstrin-like domain
LFKVEQGEEIIKVTKPHSASFLSSPIFWFGILFLFFALPRGPLANFHFIRITLVVTSLLLVDLSYIRRVFAYTFYFTDQRVVSNYSFLRKLQREIYYDKIIEVKVLQGIFGKMCGYADLWIYGYQGGWVVGRMRGVRLGDCPIVVNKAWKNKAKNT